MTDLQSLRDLLSADDTLVGRLVRALCMPKEFGKGLRLASEGAGMPSATALLPVEYKTNSWPNATVDTILSADEMQGFVFANALRSFIYYDHNPSNLQWRYDVQNNDGIGQTTFQLPVNAQTQIIPKCATLSNTAVWAPHGPVMYPGYDESGNYYLWCDNANNNSANKIYCSLNPNPATTNGSISVYRWNGKGAALWSSQQFVIGQGQYNFPAPVGGAYLFVTVFNGDTATTDITINVEGTGPTWCHRAVTNIDTIIQVAQGIRVNAAAVRWQNTASIDFKNGSISSATVARGVPWQSVAAGTNSVTSLQSYTTREAQEGYYGFPVMDDDDDVSSYYSDITVDVNPGGSVFQTAFPLDERRPYKTFAANVPVASGRATLFEATHALEYLTNSKTVEQGYAPYPAEVVEAAVMVMRSMDSDYGNPVHIRDILNSIGKYLPAAWAVAKDILSLIPNDRLGTVTNYMTGREDTVKRIGDTLVNVTSKRSRGLYR